MKNHKLTTLALSVLIVTQLLSAHASEGHNLKETLLTTNIEALEDPNFQISRPVLEELTEEQGIELLNESTEGELNTDLLEIPSVSSKPRNLTKSSILGKMKSSYYEDEDEEDSIFANSSRTTAGRFRSRLGPSSNASNVIMMIDDLVAIGQKVSTIISRGQPIVTNNPMNAVSVVPVALSKQNVDGTMQNWSLPKTRYYSVAYANGFGITVAKFVCSVSFQHSGTYKGKGKYLNGIRTAAKKIDVMYGYKLDAKSKLLQISNVGNKNGVIAGAQIEMEYTVKNISRIITNVDAFFVTGDGRIIKQ